MACDQRAAAPRRGRALDAARGPSGRTRAGRPGPRPGSPARPAAGRRPSRRRAGARRRPGRRRCGRCRARRARAGRARAARCAPPRRRRAGGGPPVDGAHVVADDVLAQRVELRALAAHQHAARPSSSRSRASRAGGACGDSNAGSTRTAHGTSSSPGGRPGRAVRASVRSPDRRAVAPPGGAQGRGHDAAFAGGQVERCRWVAAPAEGGQASRSTPRTGRRPGLATSRDTCVDSPSRTPLTVPDPAH